MKKIFQFMLVFLLVSSFGFRSEAQTKVPSYQVYSVTNYWDFLQPSNNTVQATFDFLDEILDPWYASWTNNFQLDSSAWTVLPDSVVLQDLFDFLDTNLVSSTAWTNLPDNGSLQALLTWIDLNWPTNVSLSKQYLPGTNIVGGTFNANQWTLPATGVPVTTSSWEVLAPATADAQATFDDLDEYLGYVSSNLNVSTVAGAAKLAYNNGFGANKPTNSFNNGTAAVFTNGLHAAINSNTNILKWETNGRLTIKRAGTYFYYSSAAAYRTSAAPAFAYAYHYNSTGGLKTASSIVAVDLLPDTSEGAGVLVAIDAEVDDYLITQFAAAGTNTTQGTITLGAQYIFAYKVYNTD